MKTVFASHHDLAEAFVAGTSPHGRAKSMLFEDDKIYSWGKHFVIAVIDRVNKTALFTTKKVSVSTAKHKSIVSSALHRAGYAISPLEIQQSANWWDAKKEAA